ncbi:hypothetical protein Acr_29g0000530 [Actinidia rufa]|uniref:Uncharacterized protein n=1 Tax=Actinidia rufa TaxID=165716 RepID=A0A7J0HD40_9ERIC|nr:hypothetical protein Acr_29g0000530 [Actinidia rufa]
MGSLSVLFRFWKICFGHVYLILGDHGRITCTWWSSHITIVIKQALEWHLLRRCMADLVGHPFAGTDVGEAALAKSDWVRDTTEKVVLIRKRLLTAQSRQKSYADRRKRHLEFAVGIMYS